MTTIERGHCSTSKAIDGLKRQLSANSISLERIQARQLASPRPKQGRRSYLKKRHEESGAQARRSKIMDSMFTGVDSLPLEVKDDADSYLKRLLKSNMDIDPKSKVRKTKRRVKKQPKLIIASPTSATKKSPNSPSTKRKKEKKEVRKSLEDSVSTAFTTDVSDSSLSSLNLGFDDDDDTDYSDKYKPFDSHTVKIELPEEHQNGSVTFSLTAQCGYVDDELSESDYDRLFYTDDELAEQRHDAFLEMIESEDPDSAAYSSFSNSF